MFKILAIVLSFNAFSAADDLKHLIINKFDVFTTERVNCNFEVINNMHDWENDWGENCLLMGAWHGRVSSGMS